MLPSGTVTLLLADIERSTQLWETQADEMTVAITRLDQALTELVVTHGGSRPVEQGEGDSFVLAFTSASDAVTCALDLQHRPLAPIRLRVGLHTGQVQLRDHDNYVGPTINKAARLRDLAYGGQTVLSSTTEMLVADFLPPGTWLIDLGRHELRGMSRMERVVQLCHRELHNEFPPLQTAKSADAGSLPVHLTSFVGHRTEIDEIRQIVAVNRLVTLTGAGGVGKTRFAIEVAHRLEAEFTGHVSFVDLAPITAPDLVPVAVGRALGLPDQPGRCMSDAIGRFVGDRWMAVVLDNCEHVLDACANLITGLLGACPRLRLLATSREPISVAGEITWRIPSLSLEDEALDLFADRACRARPDFRMTDENVAVIKEICRRLDGMPLAIELAAARVRAFSLDEIVGSLHDRFRLLTGGSRTAMRRQQTLRASVDWSHALLTVPERVLFRRLAVFMGGFDLRAAEAVAAGSDVERYQVLDQLALLVDKSLVVAENNGTRTRYRLLETVRQYALEKLDQFGEADTFRSRHRDYYAAMATSLDESSELSQRIAQAENENANLRAAFVWSRENSDTAAALQLASSLQPLWLARGHIVEGLTWLESVLSDDKARSAAPAIWARAFAAKGTLLGWIGIPGSIDDADHALAIAHDIGDKALLARVLIARGSASLNESDSAKTFLAEAASIAREIGDQRMLSHTLVRLASTAVIAGDPGGSTTAAATEALRAADAIGHRFLSRQCRWVLGWVSTSRGDLAEALAGLRTIADEAAAEHDVIILVSALVMEAHVRAYQGDGSSARASADAAVRICMNLAESYEAVCHGAVVVACLADGDAMSALRASDIIQRRIQDAPAMSGCFVWSALAPLAFGDLATARRWAEEAVSLSKGWYAAAALCIRARVEIAHGDVDRAERDTQKALAIAAGTRGYVVVPYLLECMADLANAAGRQREAVMLLGAADAAWKRMDSVRFKILDADHLHFVAQLRDILGVNAFEEAWTNGTGLSTAEAIAYAQHRSGERSGLFTGSAVRPCAANLLPNALMAVETELGTSRSGRRPEPS
ncbi:MAG TPA: adenylate/guanylate cyclase domain-containing protein [Mycobacterium sp.]|uniref:adenylate/guanylate cyclase domain-containing protein n=1 Tax=Mycobacterium sp. TaxID=1785 RepID=UPI002F3F4F07